MAPRQLAVVKYAVHGYSNREISKEMGIAQKTVSEYLRLAYRKYGFKGRLPMIAHFIKVGFNEDHK